MVNIDFLTHSHLTLNLLLASVTIMLVFSRVNGQLTAINGGSGRNSEYGSSNGHSGSSGGSGGNGEVLMSKTSPLSAQEPTCEELRAMWRFSKRQSRAAEVTNEIPTYRDPFAYNIWEPYIATTRSIGGMRLSQRYRDATRPVYGRILHREPLANLVDRNRAMEDLPRGYGSDGSASKVLSPEARRRVQFRFSGYGPGNPNQLTAHHGSFQKLKELIWTERARELATQRKAEELAARAAVLKEIANGQNFALRHQFQQQSSPLTDENRNPDVDHTAGFLTALPTGQKTALSPSIFSAKSSSVVNNVGVHSSLRSGVPSLVGSSPPSSSSSHSSSIGQLRTYGYRQPGTSIFRERNRALYRQAALPPYTPGEYYQRDLRKDSVDMSKQDTHNAEEFYESEDNDYFPSAADIKSLAHRNSKQFHIQELLQSYYDQPNLSDLDDRILDIFY